MPYTSICSTCANSVRIGSWLIASTRQTYAGRFMRSINATGPFYNVARESQAKNS